MKNLFIDTYINPIISLNSDDITKYEQIIADYINRLSYLKNEEIVYVNCDYQLELVRMIEYMKAILKTGLDELRRYDFRDVMICSDNSNKIIDVKNYLQISIKSISKYYKFNIDIIPSYNND